MTNQEVEIMIDNLERVAAFKSAGFSEEQSLMLGEISEKHNIPPNEMTRFINAFNSIPLN